MADSRGGGARQRMKNYCKRSKSSSRHVGYAEADRIDIVLVLIKIGKRRVMTMCNLSAASPKLAYGPHTERVEKAPGESFTAVKRSPRVMAE